MSLQTPLNSSILSLDNDSIKSFYLLIITTDSQANVNTINNNNSQPIQSFTNNNNTTQATDNPIINSTALFIYELVLTLLLIKSLHYSVSLLIIEENPNSPAVSNQNQKNQYMTTHL
jgi:hypothetical protein